MINKTIVYTLMVVGVVVFVVVASDLTYTPFAPQTGDSELVISHKTAVNISGIRTSIGETTDGPWPGKSSLIAIEKFKAGISPTPTATSTPTPTP